MRRLVPFLALALAGCGSIAEAELPAPAGPPRSPALAAAPAGQVERRTGPPSAAVDGYCRDQLALQPLAGQRQVAVLCGRERSVEVFDAASGRKVASAPAGIGPTGMVTDGKDGTYVIDALGEALLVYRRTPLQLIRRVHLGGGPYAIAYDRERWGLWITRNGANQVVFYKAGWRPVLKETYPSIRDAREIDVDGSEVTVHGAQEVQTLRPRTK